MCVQWVCDLSRDSAHHLSEHRALPLSGQRVLACHVPISLSVYVTSSCSLALVRFSHHCACLFVLTQIKNKELTTIVSISPQSRTALAHEFKLAPVEVSLSVCRVCLGTEIDCRDQFLYISAPLSAISQLLSLRSSLSLLLFCAAEVYVSDHTASLLILSACITAVPASGLSATGDGCANAA